MGGAGAVKFEARCLDSGYPDFEVENDDCLGRFGEI